MVVHCLPLVELSAPLLLWLGGAGGLAPLYEYALGEAAFARERRLLCANVNVRYGEERTFARGSREGWRAGQRGSRRARISARGWRRVLLLS
jgi:hypothetical protein